MAVTYELDGVLDEIEKGEYLTLDMLGWDDRREAYETNFGSCDWVTFLTVIKRNQEGFWQIAILTNKKTGLLWKKRTILYEDKQCSNRSEALDKLNDYFLQNVTNLRLEHSKNK
jgi:hypothetical protein